MSPHYMLRSLSDHHRVGIHIKLCNYKTKKGLKFLSSYAQSVLQVEFICGYIQVEGSHYKNNFYITIFPFLDSRWEDILY
jgi:hypothetical protein